MHAVSINLSQENRRKRRRRKEREKKEKKLQQEVSGAFRSNYSQSQTLAHVSVLVGRRRLETTASVSEVFAFFTIVSVPFSGFLVRDVSRCSADAGGITARAELDNTVVTVFLH